MSTPSNFRGGSIRNIYDADKTFYSAKIMLDADIKLKKKTSHMGVSGITVYCINLSVDVCIPIHN